MSFRCIKAFMHAFSGRFSRTCLEGISFNFFVCFIFNVSLGSAPKRKNFDIQRITRVASGGQFTLNYHTPSHILLTGWIGHCSVLKYCSIISFLYWRKLRFGPLFCPATSLWFWSFLRGGAERGSPPSLRGGSSIPGRCPGSSLQSVMDHPT